MVHHPERTLHTPVDQGLLNSTKPPQWGIRRIAGLLLVEIACFITGCWRALLVSVLYREWAALTTGVTEFYDLWLDPYQLKSQHNANEYATVRVVLFA